MSVLRGFGFLFGPLRSAGHLVKGKGTGNQVCALKASQRGSSGVRRCYMLLIGWYRTAATVVGLAKPDQHWSGLPGGLQHGYAACWLRPVRLSVSPFCWAPRHLSR